MTAERQAELFAGVTARSARARLRARRRLAAAGVGCLAAALLAGPLLGWQLPFGAREGGPEGAAHRPAASTAPLASSRARAASGWQALRVPGIGFLELSPEAAPGFGPSETPQAYVLRQHAGLLRAWIEPQLLERPVVVETPHVRVVVIGTRFEVRVNESSARVDVLEGRVRVETAVAALELGAGEGVESDDPRLAVPPRLPEPARAPGRWRSSGRLSAAPRPSPGSTRAHAMRPCGPELDPQALRLCYARLAQGDGMAAQNALYALGLHARDVERRPDLALEHWRQYERRFPAGALLPEATLGIFDALLKLRRTEEALAAGERFEQRFPDDPRANEVRLVRARVLCASPDHRPRGKKLLEQLAAGGPGAGLGQLDLVRRLCEESGPAQHEQHRTEELGR